MSARSQARRVLVKLGILKRRPYKCLLCGYVVPLVGSRYQQAAVAYAHYELKHWEPTAQMTLIVHQCDSDALTARTGTNTGSPNLNSLQGVAASKKG